jgi:hypothetical protein
MYKIVSVPFKCFLINNFLTFILLKYTELKWALSYKEQHCNVSNPGEIRTHDLLFRWRRR